jgi:alkylmercury lyase-like protein
MSEARADRDGFPGRTEAVRALVYDSAMKTGIIPSAPALAKAIGAPVDELRLLLRQLAQDHMLVLQPGNDEILMAMPYSAVPTTFVVETDRYQAFANCIWDAFGIGSMIGQAVTIRTSCPCCGFQLLVDTNRPLEDGAIAHFGVPAARWWENVTFT